jgi:site-specific DNA recombinase
MSVPLPETSRRATIYCRVSTQEQQERGYSLDAQARDCQKRADDDHLTVVSTFQDTDSGAAWDLPGLNAMLDAAKSGAFDVVIVYDPDRLARGMAKQLVIEDELKRAGVSLCYVTVKVDDNAEGRLFKNIRASFSEYEREKIAFRTSRGRREKAEQGLVVGLGMAPYGLRYTRECDRRGQLRVVGLEPDPETAPVVERIFKDAQTIALADLAQRLNADGVPTYRGGTAGWGVSTLVGILSNTVYLGQATYGKRDRKAKRWRDRDEWIIANVPALIDQATWDATHEAMSTRRARYRKRRINAADDPYALRSLLTCGHCGGALACVPNNGFRYYKCIRSDAHGARRLGTEVCDLPPVYAETLEAHAWERLSAALLDPDRLAQGLADARSHHDDAGRVWQERRDTLTGEITKLRRRLDRITVERLDAEPGSETERTLKAAADESERTIGRLSAELVNLQPPTEHGLSADDAASLEQFAAEIRRGIERVTPAQQAQLYQLIRLNGTVRLDMEHGRRFGTRSKHAHTVDWQGVIELSAGNRDTKKTRVRYFTPEMEEWEAKYMPAAAAAS